MKKRYVAIALCAVCVLGGITFLFGHKKSATEVEDTEVTEVVTEEVSEEDSEEEEPTEVTEEVTVEISEETTVTAKSTEETTETTTEKPKKSKEKDLNEIGIKVGDSYEFEYSDK